MIVQDRTWLEEEKGCKLLHSGHFSTSNGFSDAFSFADRKIQNLSESFFCNPFSLAMAENSVHEGKFDKEKCPRKNIVCALTTYTQTCWSDLQMCNCIFVRFFLKSSMKYWPNNTQNFIYSNLVLSPTLSIYLIEGRERSLMLKLICIFNKTYWDQVVLFCTPH